MCSDLLLTDIKYAIVQYKDNTSPYIEDDGHTRKSHRLAK